MRNTRTAFANSCDDLPYRFRSSRELSHQNYEFHTKQLSSNYKYPLQPLLKMVPWSKLDFYVC